MGTRRRKEHPAGRIQQVPGHGRIGKARHQPQGPGVGLGLHGVRRQRGSHPRRHVVVELVLQDAVLPEHGSKLWRPRVETERLAFQFVCEECTKDVVAIGSVRAIAESRRGRKMLAAVPEAGNQLGLARLRRQVRRRVEPIVEDLCVDSQRRPRYELAGVCSRFERIRLRFFQVIATETPAHPLRDRQQQHLPGEIQPHRPAVT